MKFGDLTTAERVLTQVKIKSIINSNTMMNDYNMNKQREKCLKLFNMRCKSLHKCQTILDHLVDV